MELGRALFCTTGSLGQGNRQKDVALMRMGRTRGRGAHKDGVLMRMGQTRERGAHEVEEDPEEQ